MRPNFWVSFLISPVDRPFSDDEFQATPEPVRLYIVQLEGIVSKLLNETEDLKKRVAKLENRVNQNSQNSSKPS